MKSTPLTEVHISLGAKMASFAGFNMPISYSGIIEEHMAVRNRVGIFDVSHMGEFIIKGKEALNLIQSISTNDAAKLQSGEAQYSCMPNDQGGIVDDLLVYKLFDDACAADEQAFMLVVNAGNIQKDFDWIIGKNKFDTRIIDISEQTGLLAVQGPMAAQMLQSLTDIDLASIPYYSFTKGTIAGIDNVVISATGYTGSGGFELYCHADNTLALWQAVMAAGAAYGILPCGLGARDTLRLEKGYALYGNDINDTTSPLEAGLGWITKLNKEENFSSKQIFKTQKRDGLMRTLVGFLMQDRRVPRHDYEVYDGAEMKIGVVTSGTQSPSLDAPIGLAYVSTNYSKPGTNIKIKIGSKLLDAVVVKLPFL
jgi:aminomethyltransferase